MFRHILVATGGSPWSRNAVETAVRLASAWKAALTVVHILEDDPQYQPQEMVVSDPQLRAQLEEAGQQLVEHATGLARQAQVSSKAVTAWGPIPEQLVHYATDAHCDLIVMGTRHLTGEKRLMTGRICNAVIATAPCPVLIVPLVQEGT